MVPRVQNLMRYSLSGADPIHAQPWKVSASLRATAQVYNLKRFMFTKVRFFIILNIRDEEIDTQSFNLK